MGILNWLLCALLHGRHWVFEPDGNADCPICKEPRIVKGL